MTANQEAAEQQSASTPRQEGAREDARLEWLRNDLATANIKLREANQRIAELQARLDTMASERVELAEYAYTVELTTDIPISGRSTTIKGFDGKQAAIASYNAALSRVGHAHAVRLVLIEHLPDGPRAYLTWQKGMR